jgi:predicted nucleic acid-binding Zn ribbon protein
MVERVPQHRHCQNCDRAVPYKDKFCDEKCENEYKSKLRMKKRQLIYFYLAMVAVFVVSIAMIFLR